VKTIVPKITDIQHNWYLIDAQNVVLGRLASQIATLLRGKHKPMYTPHLDVGDHVVVVNASQLKLTGRKTSLKQYTSYTGYPGGLRVKKFDTILKSSPDKVLYHAVKGMLPKNRLGRKMIKKLRIYPGPDHQQLAQKPEVLPNHLRRI
jgi:large subunit ribosomal protein L13